MNIDWDWTPVHKGHDLFQVELCVCVSFDTNSSFYIDGIIIDGVMLDNDDDLFLVIKRDLDNDDRFQDYVFEKREREMA